jgi:hypothetical protein
MPRPQEETIEFNLSWDDYLSSLDPWERMLLQRIHFLHQSPFDIHQQLSDAPLATMVSDGDADHFQGSAGWVIAVGNRRIIQGQCPVPGFDPQSYRAEGYGMIGGLLFLRHLCLYCGHFQLLPLHKMYCDNLGLVTKVSKLLSFRLAPTQAALHSEFDVLATIHDLLRDFSLTPTIVHVKGHQDNHKPYEDLSLPAQLNCDADVLATNELLNYPTTCIHVPLLPPAIVQLTIGGTTITRKLGPTIRRQHGLGLLKAYTHERFRWTNDMVVSMNWEAFSQAFRSRYRFRTFTFKLCFWQLPTGKTLHTPSPRFDLKCPACSHASECNDHMFQCKAISRRRWKSSFIQSTRKRAEDCKTDPKLVHILLAGIRSYFDSCSPPPIPNLLTIHQSTASLPSTKPPSAGAI